LYLLELPVSLRPESGMVERFRLWSMVTRAGVGLRLFVANTNLTFTPPPVTLRVYLPPENSYIVKRCALDLFKTAS
jgi:hypothetical protein